MRLRSLLGVALVALAASNPAAAQLDELQASYDFLVKNRANGGVLFNFPIAQGNYDLPASFLDSAAYWGAYVCQGSRDVCAINDTYNPLDYQLSPASGAAGTLQVERVNAHNGANIYDAATWQIAVMLGAVKNKFTRQSPTSAYAVASTLSEVLHLSGISAEGNAAPGAKRATTAGPVFVYNGTPIMDAGQAYSFRALAPEWLARDPLTGSPYAAFVTASALPAPVPAYTAGKISWSDWKPITGENAWAFLIGPLQAAYLHHVLEGGARFVPLDDLALQNALAVLPAFAAMQSPLGGVYYAPAGTVGNEGARPVNPHEISVENNLSLYAGLKILRATLQATRSGDASLSGAAKDRIDAALRLIDTIISGGRQTKGLLAFFKNAAWREGSFVQGGLANDPAQGSDWVPTVSPKAVDVETWGIAALGAKQIDQWFGAGASLDLWQRVKKWGGYGVGKTLWGVGYSDQDGNGVDAGGAYRQGVLSAEWTAGAIDAVRSMIRTYDADPASRKYVASLKADETAMLNALGTLRIDRYGVADMPGKPSGYDKLMVTKTKPYLYASRRYHIPFGWFANPLPSTASTAWVIMIADSYDPFGYAGAPN